MQADYSNTTKALALVIFAGLILMPPYLALYGLLFGPIPAWVGVLAFVWFVASLFGLVSYDWPKAKPQKT
jgi:hypothetical protein